MLQQETKNQLGQQFFLAVIIVILYIITHLLNPSMQNIQLAVGIFLITELANIAFLYWKKRLTWEYLVTTIIGAGIAMRIGYMLYTPFDVRTHDLGEVRIDAYGHAAYLLKIINNHSLPETNTVQLYQQPFYYIVAAIVSKGICSILKLSTYTDYLDAAKVVSCYASCGVLLLNKKVCQTFHLKGRGAVIATALVAFVPDFYLISSRLNADALICYIMLLAFLITIDWYDDPNWKNTLLLALVYGIGMMTKISMASMALLTATFFLVRLIRADAATRKKIVPRLCVFGVISLPLGLWYSVRNYYLFGQSLTYVPDIGKDLDIYIGNRSFATRFLTFSLENYFKTPYAYPWQDYNEPIYIIKSALFGEFVYDIEGVIPTLLLFFALILSGLAVIQLIAVARRKEKEKNDWYVIILIGIMLVSIVTFAIRYPYGCSMDYRYYVILCVAFGVVLGRKPAYGFMNTAIPMFLTLMSLGSCLMYLLIQ